MQNRPLLLGHRGARGEKSVPENTLASFDLALAEGCDGFEFDVRLAADGQAVVGHNETAHGLRIGRSSARDLGLPLLRDVLTRYQKSAFLDIELKVPGLEKITANLLRTLPPARGFVISSFLPEVLKTLNGLDAAIPLGLICESRSQFSLWPQLPVAYVIAHHTLLRRDVVSQIKAGSRKILVWTVNVQADIKRFAEWGVDGIISDHPKRLARSLASPLRRQIAES